MLLGFYDVAKKQSLRDNHVVTVLCLSVCFSTLMLLPCLIGSACGWIGSGSLLYVPQVDMHTHLFIVVKAALVLSSWVCAYAALKHLPITIVAPLNATRPMWTLIGAVLLFGERLNAWQWAGVVVALGSFYAFSVIGKREGVSVRSEESRLWVFCLLGAILLGAASGLYDKYLMKQFDHMAVQVYYTTYQALMMLAVLGVDLLKRKRQQKAVAFHWHWSIAMISLFLVLSDFVYFIALSDPDSLIAVVSTVRRSGCVIPFLYGIFVLKDSSPKAKSVCLAGVLLGILCLLFASI